MAEHTPTPWHVRPGNDFDFGKAGRIGATAVDDVATCWVSDSHNGEANAAFVVKAANHFDQMVEALTNIASTFDESYRDGCLERRIGDLARAALPRSETNNG
jgi:pyocin large subunit-like protein